MREEAKQIYFHPIKIWRNRKTRVNGQETKLNLNTSGIKHFIPIFFLTVREKNVPEFRSWLHPVWRKKIKATSKASRCPRPSLKKATPRWRRDVRIEPPFTPGCGNVDIPDSPNEAGTTGSTGTEGICCSGIIRRFCSLPTLFPGVSALLPPPPSRSFVCAAV